jgi:dTDP-4-dehydrorhamnose reductase
VEPAPNAALWWRDGRLIRPLAPGPAAFAALVIGASGLVGGACFAALRARGHDVRARTPRTGARACRVRLQATLEPRPARERREVVVMASALTHVDFCETHATKRAARNVGRRATAWRRPVAAAGAALLSFSTDYVFDGHGGPL